MTGSLEAWGTARACYSHRASPGCARAAPPGQRANPPASGPPPGPAAAALLGPNAVTSARAGKGHPLKHRVLDLASSAIQRKYPVEAISTYLNGFHMYADDMGRQALWDAAADGCQPPVGSLTGRRTRAGT